MIQDIEPKIYQIGYEKRTTPSDESVILLYHKRSVLCQVSESGELHFPCKKELDFKLGECSYQYLFQIDEISFFTIPDWDGKDVRGFAYENIELFRTAKPKWLSFAGVSGFQLCSWYQSKKFCSCCGGRMSHSETERAVVCESCGKIEYPTLSPSVIVAVTKGDRILLTKYARNHSKYANYALIAGYAELGESLEDTVRREVYEEIGLKVTNITYYKSQPWSFSGALLVGFFCEVEGDDTVRLDLDELCEGTWFSRKEIPARDNGISLTNEMIEQFRTGQWKFAE